MNDMAFGLSFRRTEEYFEKEIMRISLQWYSHMKQCKFSFQRPIELHLGDLSINENKRLVSGGCIACRGNNVMTWLES